MDISLLARVINQWKTQVEQRYDSKTVYMTAVHIKTDYPVKNGMIPSSHQTRVKTQERNLELRFNNFLEEYHVLLKEHSPRPKAERFTTFFVDRLPHNGHRWDGFIKKVKRGHPTILGIECEDDVSLLANAIFRVTDRFWESFLNSPEDVFVLLHVSNIHNKEEWKTVAINLRQCATQLMVGQLYKKV